MNMMMMILGTFTARFIQLFVSCHYLHWYKHYHMSTGLEWKMERAG